MWSEARKDIEAIFFKDEVKLYKNTTVEDDLGEEHNTPVLVGSYPCNIEDGQTSKVEGVSGASLPQSLRISTLKSIPLTKGNTYALVIVSARIAFDATEYLDVASWVEGQLSTVITATRRVDV